MPSAATRGLCGTCTARKVTHAELRTRIEAETVSAIVARLREPSVAAEMSRQPMTVADFIEREWKRGTR